MATINVRDYIVIESVDYIQRGYVANSMQSIPPVTFKISNLSDLFEVSVGFNSIAGIIFSPASLTLSPQEEKNFVVGLDPASLNTLPEGVNAIDIVANVSVTNMQVVLEKLNTVISSVPPIDGPPTGPKEPTGLPAAIWKNGITRETLLGLPPENWELRVDGFWYPIVPQISRPFTPTVTGLRPPGSRARRELF